MKLSLTKVLLGVLVLYILYRMFMVREGLENKTRDTIITIVVLLVVGGLFLYLLMNGSFFSFV